MIRENKYNEEYMENRRKEILRLCRSVLTGDIGIIEGSRSLRRFETDVSEKRDSDFTIFVGIDSETDHLPIGSTRKLWSNSALVEKDEEIKKFESFYREKAFAACTKIIERFGGAA